MSAFSRNWVLPICVLLVAGCAGPVTPYDNSAIVGGQAGTTQGEASVNPMPVVVGPTGLHSR